MYRRGLHDVEAIFVIVLPLHLQLDMVIIGHVSLLAQLEWVCVCMCVRVFVCECVCVSVHVG